MSSRPIHLDSIRLDGDTQPRAEIDESVVAEYAEAMEAGAEFPPIVVFHDGATYWLADGFHRYHAMRRVGLTAAKFDLRSGTRREAILHSVGSNATHGKRRTNADKRKAVITMLTNPLVSLGTTGKPLSDQEIARLCAVDAKTVAKYREETAPTISVAPISGNSKDNESGIRTVTRGGTTYDQDTSNIGRRAEAPRQEPGAEAPTPAEENGNALPKPPRRRHFGPTDLERVRESVDVVYHLSHEPLSRLPYAELKQQVAELREYLTQFTD